MKQVATAAAKALLQGSRFQSSNIEVLPVHTKYLSYVLYFDGKEHAFYNTTTGTLSITDAGRRTPNVRTILNAVLNEFNHDYRITQNWELSNAATPHIGPTPLLSHFTLGRADRVA